MLVIFRADPLPGLRPLPLALPELGRLSQVLVPFLFFPTVILGGIAQTHLILQVPANHPRRECLPVPEVFCEGGAHPKLFLVKNDKS